nr:hypothetical protein [Nesterenkonia sp.]
MAKAERKGRSKDEVDEIIRSEAPA